MLYEPVAQVLPRTWAFAEEHVPSLKSLSEEFGGRIQSQLSTARDEATRRAIEGDQ
jgi:hypothetical protein